MEDEQQFKKLSPKKLRRLKMDELVMYRKRERAYLLTTTDEGQIGYKIRQLAHPLLLGALEPV